MSLTSRFLVAVSLAAVVAGMAIYPQLGRIATWKIVLAVVGVILFIVAGRGQHAS